jgi:hypothetical protein
MLKLELLNHWIVPQQGENHSEIDEEPFIKDEGRPLAPELAGAGCKPPQAARVKSPRGER